MATSRRRHTICARAFATPWSIWKGPTPWCWPAPIACTRSATPTASARCASARCPRAAVGWFPAKRAVWTLWAPNTCATLSRARSCASPRMALRPSRAFPQVNAPAASSSTCISPAPTPSWTASRCTRRAATWAAFWPARRRPRPIWCLACPTAAFRRLWGLRLKAASRIRMAS